MKLFEPILAKPCLVVQIILYKTNKSEAQIVYQFYKNVHKKSAILDINFYSCRNTQEMYLTLCEKDTE